MSYVDTSLNLLNEEQKRAARLGLWGVLAHWNDLDPAMRTRVCDAQMAERHARSLARRVLWSRVGNFKPIADFNWDWPEVVDRVAIEDLLQVGFLAEAVNPVLIGPTGIGKSMIAKNIAHAALLRGRTVRSVSVADMLSDLQRNPTGDGRQRALRRYTSPALLVLEDLAHTAYDNAQTDLLFAVIAARHLRRSTMVTTAYSFGQWHQHFPSLASVHKLIDLLANVSEVVQLAGKSYRHHEALERQKRVDEERLARRVDGPRRGGGPKGGIGKKSCRLRTSFTLCRRPPISAACAARRPTTRCRRKCRTQST